MAWPKVATQVRPLQVHCVLRCGQGCGLCRPWLLRLVGGGPGPDPGNAKEIAYLLAGIHLCVSLDKMEEVTGERDVWASLLM